MTQSFFDYWKENCGDMYVNDYTCEEMERLSREYEFKKQIGIIQLLESLAKNKVIKRCENGKVNC